MAVPIPDYKGDYPKMPDNWLSDTFFDLGWISELYKTANKAIGKIYGVYDQFHLNEDDLLNFDDLDADAFKDNPGPVIYLAIWVAILAIFMLVGIIWCVCANKCCCCCRSNFKKARKDNESNGREFGGVSVVAIVLSVLMAVWLIGYLIMILHTFATNDKTKEAIDRIQPDLENAIDDVDNYITVTRKQLNYSFDVSFGSLSDAVMEVVKNCQEIECDFIKDNVKPALDKTKEQVSTSLNELDKALRSVQDTMKEGKEQLDGDFEDIIKDANKGLYIFFMVLNLLYCAIFVLVLVGTVFAAFGRRSGFKTGGFLLIRGAIVLIFIVGIFVIVQLATMFVLSGIASEIICPAVRELEINSSSTLTGMKQAGDKYVVPNYAVIMRACMKDKSAYEAFNLETAYPIEDIMKITDYFNGLPDVPGHPIKHDINRQVTGYAEFVVSSTKQDLGKCGPVYNAVNATISLFCDKLTAPVMSYWFILQFYILAFVLIIITALYFERLHS